MRSCNRVEVGAGAVEVLVDWWGLPCINGENCSFISDDLGAGAVESLVGRWRLPCFDVEEGSFESGNMAAGMV